MNWRIAPMFTMALLPTLADAELTGYIKSFAVTLDSVDTPLIEANRHYQSQNSVRLMWQEITDNISWQVHYELSPVLNSSRIGFDNATFATGANNYRLSDPETVLNNEDDKHRLSQNLDRLNVQLKLDQGDLTLGRQAISPGAARIINPTDVFLPFDVRTFNQEYRIGVDAVRFQYPFGQLGEIDTGIILGDDAESGNSAIFARIRENMNGHDLQLSAIRFANQNLVGVGIQTSLGRLGTWVEAAHVSGDIDYWRVSVGFDHAFSTNVFGMVEYHYNGAGSSNPDRYRQTSTTLPYEKGGVFLLGEQYLIPALNWQLTPLWTLAIQSLHNLNDRSAFISVTAQYNVAADFYMDFGYYHFRGDTLRQEKPGLPVLESEYGTNPDTMFASIRYYF